MSQIMLLKELMREEYAKSGNWNKSDKQSVKLAKEEFVVLVLLVPTISSLTFFFGNLFVEEAKKIPLFMTVVLLYVGCFIMWVIVRCSVTLTEKKMKREIEHDM